MHEQSQNPDSNPLDDLANDLSDTFGDAPVEMNETVAGDVKGGQIWMKQSAARSVERQCAASGRVGRWLLLTPV